MNSIIALTFAVGHGLLLASLSFAQTPDTDAPKPEDAYVRILNGCDTSQSERWRTGVDLKFKDKIIGADIRLGEKGPLGKISFIGRDTIDVYRHGDSSQSIASVPAKLQQGGFYTLVVLGDLEASSADLKVAVVQEFPLAQESQRSGQCRIVLINTVSAYPVGLSIGNNPPQKLPYGEVKELFLPPGELDLGLWFTDKTGKSKRLQAGMIAEAGANFTAIVHPSQERSDRPAFFRINSREDRAMIQEVEAEAAITASPQATN